MITLHNFSSKAQKVFLKAGCERDNLLVDVFDGDHSRVGRDRMHRIDLDRYAWRWYRVGAADNALERSELNILPKARTQRGLLEE